MHAARSRMLFASLNIALAVQLHHHIASCFLFHSFHNHGFHSLYKAVKRLGPSAAVYQGTDIPNNTKEFIQYAADNVNHTIIDGNDTFHARPTASRAPKYERHIDNGP